MLLGYDFLKVGRGHGRFARACAPDLHHIRRRAAGRHFYVDSVKGVIHIKLLSLNVDARGVSIGCGNRNVFIATIQRLRAGSGGTRNSGSGVSTAIKANQVVARCRVSAVTSGSNAVTLTAIDIDNDGSETFDLEANDPFVIISRGDEEGSRSPEAWSDDLEKVWNSTQIIKTPVEITGTLYNMTKLRGASNELARLRDLKAKEHKMKANRAMMLGVRVGGTGAPTGHLTGASGYPIRTTMGAIPMLQKYGVADEQVFDRAWATYDIDDFIDDMEKIAQYDNAKTEKFAFAGSSVLAELAKTGESSFFTRSGGSISLSNWQATSFGFDVRVLTHPFGKLYITWDPSLRYEPYKNTMAVFDPDHIQRVIYRNDQYQTALQENDADMVKDQYFSDCGLGMTLVEKHSLFQFA